MAKPLSGALADLGQAADNLKRAVRVAILRHLGVDRLVKRAFEEGWRMHAETDQRRIDWTVGMTKGGIDQLVHETRTWRSVAEAWANSDVEEEV